MTAEPTTSEAQTWEELTAELSVLVPRPTEALVVVADDFPQTVDAYARLTPFEYGGAGETVEAYNPAKPDGARAGAKTIPLAEQTVIVVDARSSALGPANLRRLLHHEAQHVRLRQHEDTAWAMQRRGPFTRPAGSIFAFAYLAQSMVDEYRCEVALETSVALASTAMTVAPPHFAEVSAVFTTITRRYQANGDLEEAFISMLAGLDRLVSFVAYAAATVTRGEQPRAAWAAVEPVMIVLDDLLAVPSAVARMMQPDLAEVAEHLTSKIGLLAESVGFRVDADENTDQTSFFLLNLRS